MGALHEGHLSLVKKAVAECDAVVVSVFVNPTQFNNKNDFNTYPRTLEADCRLLEPTGVAIVFAPQVKDVYPEPDTRVFDFGNLDKFGEGPARPGHFNGMAQIVTRLFDIVKPQKAFFGEKDFQQLALIRYFVKQLNYNLEIVPCPILREADGLALSSRNTLLTPERRAAAPHIYKAICEAAKQLKDGGYQMNPRDFEKLAAEKINERPELETEYVEVVDSFNLQKIENWNDSESIRLWCAVHAGEVRLIDNIAVK